MFIEKAHPVWQPAIMYNRWVKKKLFIVLFLLALIAVTFLFVYSFFLFSSRKSVLKQESRAIVQVPLTPLPTQAQLLPDWQNIALGMQVKSLPYTYVSNTYDIQVIKIDPAYFSLHLDYDVAGKTVSSWAKGSEGVVLNAGFFKQENKPVGLLYIDGDRVDNHRIKPEGTGLLVIHQNSIDLIDLSSHEVPDEAQLQNALQAYPMLISDSQIAVKESLQTQERRTAIGKDRQGNIYIFSVQYPHLGLYEFAKILHDSSLQLSEVLNLDGGGSTGVAINMPEYKRVIDSQTLIPTVLKVEEK